MKKVLLLILDGWGINPETEHNPIAAAQPAFWNSLLKQYPSTKLSAKEDAVGVPKGCLSNSEIGHTAIGAGRVVPQSAFAIDTAIQKNTFVSNSVLGKAEAHIKHFNSTLHLVGMLSSGGVHSHIDHLLALVAWAKTQEISRVALHLLLDGRDMPPMSALPLVENVQHQLTPGVQIVSLCGRAIGMDRTENWDRTLEFYNTITSSTEKDILNIDSVSYIKQNYQEGITDEFIAPARFCNISIQENDAVLFFNFRADRMRQLVKLFTSRAPHAVQKNLTIPKNTFLASMANYDETFTDVDILFPKTTPVNNLGEWVSKQSGRQLRITETEKYAHVTYFINGGQEIQYPNEERLVIPSLGLKSYASEPQMSLPEVTSSLIRAVQTQHFDLVICNIANGDMVGHSGDYEAALQAIHHVDEALSQIIPVAQEYGYTIVITADHGNIEHMHDGEQPHTAHTFHDVPCIVVSDKKISLLSHGELHQVAPTVLQLMELPQPSEMTSTSLITSL